MRILFVLTCCFGLASFTQAAQKQQDENNLQPKKKGGQSVQSSQQVVTPKGTPKGHVYSNPQLQTHTSKGGTYTSKGGTYTPKGSTYTPKGNVYSNPKLQTHHNKAPLSTSSMVQSKTQGYHAQHFNLANKPNPNIPNVKFRAGAHIQGSQNWQGSRYVVFRNYTAQWHDQAWWHGHHNRIVFVFGGWYFWDGGYWYPAWGYAPDAYYAYDGPIYAGSADMDPGQVVANVQAALQEQGFYHGEVDGVLGPQTRSALAEYQSANGMEPTGAIDEPTLESLRVA